MNYDTIDCRLNISAAKAAKALRRKSAKKKVRSGNRIFAAIRAVTTIVASLVAGAMVAQAQFVIQPLTEADSKDLKVFTHATSQSNLDVNAFLDPNDGENFLSMLQFDLSGVPYTSSQVTSAYITLYCRGIGVTGGGTVDPTGGIITLSPLLSDWRETGTSPGTAPVPSYDNIFLNPTIQHGSVAASTDVEGAGFVTFDVTNLVKDWLSGSQTNYGVLIQAPNAHTDVGFADVDSNVATVPNSPPSLTVVPEPGSALLALTGAAVCLVRRRRSCAA